MVYREFIGRSEKPLFLEAVRAVEGDCISPGGAALLLGVTRQRIAALIYENPRIRAWVYRRAVGQPAEYIEVSLRDILRYGVKQGTFRVGDSLPYVGVLIEEDLGVDEVASAC